MNRQPQAQAGGATLLLVLGLVVLATLASAWSTRAVLIDLVGSQTRGQALQAQLAAQAALATLEADVLQAWGPSGTSSAGPQFLADPSRRMPCPTGLTGRQWQCASMPLNAGRGLGDWQLMGWVARDLLGSPHVWQLHGWAQAASGKGQAYVRESVFVPALSPKPQDTPSAALLLNGCLGASVRTGLQVCSGSSIESTCTGSAGGSAVHSFFIPDLDGNGALSSAERQACLDPGPQAVPGVTSLGAAAPPTRRSPCDRAVWRSVMGQTSPEQLRSWSQAQADNGLDERSQPARSIYWIDSPSEWTQSLGRPEAPVLLVFSSLACAVRCPRMASGVQIHGTVLVDAACDDEKMRGWQSGSIDGLLAIEAGWPSVGDRSVVRARAYRDRAFALDWPLGIDSRQVQRVQGSHRGGP